MSKPALKVRTVILSDLHLGTPHAKADEVTHFLKHVRCERLLLNGDIIDGWRLRRDGRWTKAHTRFVRRVLTLVQKKDTDVVYLRGNHDDFLARLLPMRFDRLSLVEDYVLESASGRYLVLHGDVFDGVVKNMVFLAHLGDMGYAMLLRVNRAYNWFRQLRGKEYFSLSAAIKARVKQAVSFVGKFEEQVAALARQRGCTGVICGHIHTAADKRIGGIHYLNSGDWVESLTAIVEHHDGRFELITFKDFTAQFPMPARETMETETEGEEPLPFPFDAAAPAAIMAAMR
ncbi:UDP-2,3-diacylglucosamine hydrolase [Lacunisphaera limnophila]|uniref:UDP-2,3-diacylglucosamine hydrolase n=1 Tax=Lacunisphaera limnophila TaxID=1838286 RepID=A0A1D8AWG7_9BACT|nr:UDP-2,3-diacylglucosamine diphosphatase [Lacunisphaera limnophila]AOS45221.1 UDP-2,3-diacylglucosamine hydrolase [Lacunisphaera limnophila]